MQNRNNSQFIGNVSGSVDHRHCPSPPLCLSMMALIALLNLSYSQVWVKPVDLLRFEVFEPQPKAAWVLNIWAQTPTVQNRLDDSLMDLSKIPHVQTMCSNIWDIITRNTMNQFCQSYTLTFKSLGSVKKSISLSKDALN